MTPQTLLAIRAVLIFVAGILASRGLISKETAEYFASPAVLAVLGTIAAAATAAWGLWLNRPHGLIKAAADLPQVDAVITKPKTAGEMQVGNVVGSATEASRLPSVAA